MTSSHEMEVEEEKATTSQNKLLQLPHTRVKTIMKSSPDLMNVSQDAYFLITRATELFVQYLAQQAYTNVQKKKCLDYKSLADVVESDESLEFLEEIVPQKIKVSEYWEKIGYTPEPHEISASPKKSTKTISKSPKVSTETIVID